MVPEQDDFDGAFPDREVAQPGERRGAELGVELADRKRAPIWSIATDPDCDRMGVAVRTASGEMKLLTGNQIGSLMAYYRVKTLFDHGVLHAENAGRGVIIKTFVTTDLQKAIAEHHGLRCVETLTGFKYIGAKLGKYEARPAGRDSRANIATCPRAKRATRGCTYSRYLRLWRRGELRLQRGRFRARQGWQRRRHHVREVAAYAKSRGLTLDALLDEIFVTFGYFEEKNGSLTFEGAEGADED